MISGSASELDRDREVLASSYLGSRALDEADGGHP